jgi:hypothetical protein
VDFRPGDGVTFMPNRGKRGMDRMESNEKKWSEGFRRISTLDETKPRFSVRGAMSHLYDAYTGGHETLDQIIRLCEKEHFAKSEERDLGSPMNDASAYKDHYDFLDGGLSIYSGNYFFQERGVYIRGFVALRWILYELGYAQPRKLKGEERVLSREQMEELVAEQSG